MDSKISRKINTCKKCLYLSYQSMLMFPSFSERLRQQLCYELVTECSIPRHTSRSHTINHTFPKQKHSQHHRNRKIITNIARRLFGGEIWQKKNIFNGLVFELFFVGYCVIQFVRHFDLLSQVCSDTSRLRTRNGKFLQQAFYLFKPRNRQYFHPM